MSSKHLSQYRWDKLGLVFDSKISNPPWGKTHALVPTPITINQDTVDIYCSFLDSDFIGRIGCVTLKFKKRIPQIESISDLPVLSNGLGESFSKFGVGLGVFWPKVDPSQLLYIGFDRPKGFKFKAFTGLASKVGDHKFMEVSNLPIYGPEIGGKTIVGIHEIVKVGDEFYGFVSLGDDFEIIKDKPFPRYQIGLMKGKSIDSLKIVNRDLIKCEYPEYRIGRPQVYKVESGYELLATVGSVGGDYQPVAFRSENLFDWEKLEIGNFTSQKITGFDDRQQCYLSRFNLNGDEYVVYNGNGMGVNGFGIAVGY